MASLPITPATPLGMALSAIPSVAQPSRAAWDRATAAVRQADADAEEAIQRYYRAQDTYDEITGPVVKQQRDASVDRLTGLSRADELSDNAIDRLADARDAAILTPAPDNAALLWKIEHLFGEEADAGAANSCYCAEWGGALMSDARRLLSEGRA